MVRDDLLPFGFGTKWRKVLGIVESLQKNQIKKVLLWGAIHGNYLASFTTILRYFGFQMETISYTKDPKLKTYNERLVNLHSHSMHCYANRKEAEKSFFERSKTFDGLCLQEFGIHPAQSTGLRSFWQELESEIHKILKVTHTGLKADKRSNNVNNSHAKVATLVLEIGSGASFVSAFDYFYDSSILVLGVMVGESKSSWISKIETLQKELHLKIQKIPKESILEFPKDTSSQYANRNQFGTANSNFGTLKGVRFAKTSKDHINWIREFYQKTDIILEPIYSAKSISNLMQDPNYGDTALKNSFFQIQKDFLPILYQNLPLFYLHQGGQIQHSDFVLKNSLE